MSDNDGGLSCPTGSWALAAGAGALTTVMMLVLGDSGWIASIFLGGLVFVFLGLAFTWLFCARIPGPGERAGLEAHPPADPDEVRVTKGASAEAARAQARPAPGAAAPASSAPTASSAAKGASASSEPKKAAAASEARPDVNTASASADAEAGAQVKPSKSLKGEQDLKDRKGEWRYGVAPASQAAATPEAAATEVEGPGTMPQTLAEPRAGGADDLKKIKGVGPKLESVMQSMGFYHFDQIAAWTADEIAWVDENLVGFKGRVTRDNWVEQARKLASGEETEFSKRVDKGDVY